MVTINKGHGYLASLTLKNLNHLYTGLQNRVLVHVYTTIHTYSKTSWCKQILRMAY